MKCISWTVSKNLSGRGEGEKAKCQVACAVERWVGLQVAVTVQTVQKVHSGLIISLGCQGNVRFFRIKAAAVFHLTNINVHRI